MSKYKIGDKARTIKDRDCNGTRVFPINTLVVIITIDGDDELPYKVVNIEDGDYRYYSEDMLEPCIEKTYDQGLQDAWELARKIENETSLVNLKYLFHSTKIADILDNFTPQEALAKIEAYEQEREIKAGDFCIDEDGLEWLVTYVNKGTRTDDIDYHCMDKKGYTSPVLYHKGELTKTGKHIDIQQILDGIGAD